MAVEIYVSSEELKKTLEYVALIGGNMASGKKQDDDLKQMAGALRIVAVSPREDNNYMLMFCRAGATEQLTYRMEGISNGCGQSADICVECKRFLALAKTFTGDVRLIFAEKELQIVVESSQYNLTILSARLPDLKIPEPTNTPSAPSCIIRAASAGVATPPAAKFTTGSLPLS